MRNTNHLKNKELSSFTKEEGLVLGANTGRPTVIDLFAGCGGLSLGLYQAGWEGLFAIEKNAFAFETLKYNLIENKHHFNWPDWLPQTEHEINEVLDKYPEQLKSLRGKVDLVAGGPPKVFPWQENALRMMCAINWCFLTLSLSSWCSPR